jgi:hypothetical protein
MQDASALRAGNQRLFRTNSKARLGSDFHVTARANVVFERDHSASVLILEYPLVAHDQILIDYN